MVVMMTSASRQVQRGLTLIELMAALAIGAIVLAALNSVVKMGLDAQGAGRSANELSYRGRFALERMAARARGAAPILLANPAAGTTGTWFAPTMYCVNAGGQLIETTIADIGCIGTTVIASKVTAFSAQLPADGGPVDDPVAAFSLTLADTVSNSSVTLATNVRFGGGAL